MRRVAQLCHASFACSAPIMALSWHKIPRRCCSLSARTDATTADSSSVTGVHADSSGADATSSLMRYKSTHKGSGIKAPPRKQRNGDGPSPSSSSFLSSPSSPAAGPARGAAVGSSDAAGRANLAATRSSCVDDVGPVSGRPLSPLQRRQLLFKHKAAFTLTPQALRRVKYLLKQCSESRPQGEMASPDGIRISVRRRGCSGYSYTVNYHFPDASGAAGDSPGGVGGNNGRGSRSNGGNASCTREGDVVVVQDGVKVVVDSNALFYVIGTEMDYVVRNVEEKFTFRNPNQKYSCGCEESFMPFDENEE